MAVVSETSVLDVAESQEEEHSSKRTLTGKIGLVTSIVAFIFGVFQLITGGYRPLLGINQYVVHVGFALILVFLYYPASKKYRQHVTALDIVLIVLSLCSLIYVLPNAMNIISLTTKDSIWQIILGTVLIVMILEASRRSLGWIFPILVGIFLAYAFFGHLIPGTFSHAHFSYAMVIRDIYFNPQGLWGMMLQMSSTLLALFLVFGAVLLQTGGGEAFMNIAFWASARTRGGSAKVSAVASGLFGMISGSAVANAATIGTFTIPLMKKGGFSSEFAAAVEGAAGTGGMLMPPIMGAGAFLMAQFLGISYAKVALAAVVPAVLYYSGLLFSIHLQAVRNNMQVPPKEELQAIKSRFSFKKTVLPLVPVVFLIVWFLLGYTVQMGAFYSAIVSIVLMLFTLEGEWDRNRLKLFFKNCFKAFAAGGAAVSQIAVLLACAQIMVAILGLTGLAVKFSSLIVAVGQSNLLITLLLAMILIFFLGMGIPSTAVYVIGAAVVAPALILLGIKALPAHLFVYYFSCLGAITPPVCGAIYVTAALAKADWWKSGWLSVRLVLSGFVVPFIFVYRQTLLLTGAPLDIVIDIVLAFIGVFFISCFAVGYLIKPCNWVERICFLAAGLLLVIPGLATGIIGIIIAFSIFMLQKKRPLVAKEAA